MILFIPFFLSIIAGLVIAVVIRVRINVGRIWLITAFSALLNWGAILALRWFLPLQFTNLTWSPFGRFFDESITLHLDNYSWAFALALASIQLAIILTDSTRLEELPSLYVWSGIFMINAVGYLAVLADSILAIFLFWTMIDLVELFIVLLTVQTVEFMNVGIVSFGVKMAGILFLAVAVFSAQSQGVPISFDPLGGNASLFLLIAIGLRLGVIPFNLPYSKEIPLRIGLGNTIRMVGVASGLVVLIRITSGLAIDPENSILLSFFSLAGFVAALIWMVSENELSGRPYWVIALASFAIVSALKGDEVASLAWSLVLLLSGTVLFLFSDREWRILFIPMLAIVTLSGLPFTPSAYGWYPLAANSPFFSVLMRVTTVSLLILGFMRHALHKGDDLKLGEKWTWVVFPFGLFFLLITHWLIFLLSPFNWVQAGMPWASIPAFILPLLVYAVIRRMTRLSEYTDWVITLLNKIGAVIISILSLNWLYRALWYLLNLVQIVVNLFSSVLESQTGIIWIFILIAVFVTVIAPGR